MGVLFFSVDYTLGNIDHWGSVLYCAISIVLMVLVLLWPIKFCVITIRVDQRNGAQTVNRALLNSRQLIADS